MKKILFLLLTLLLVTSSIGAEDFCDANNVEECVIEEGEFQVVVHNSTENTACVIYFYGIGCPKCAEIKPFIDELEEKYGEEIHIARLELYHNLTNYELFNQYCLDTGIPLDRRGIPFIVIGDRYLMGVKQIREHLEEEIQMLPADGECPLAGMSCHPVEYELGEISPPKPIDLTLPVIIVAGLVDGINPCAFAVMIFLLAFLLEISSDKRRMIKAGSAYILSVYITYFLAGLGILSFIQLSGISNIIVKIAAILAILAGLINIKDYFWYGKGFSLKIPESRKESITKLVYKANVPAALVLGVAVAMFELPCTGGVYLAILAMLSGSTLIYAIQSLLIYNLMFVLPLLLIFALVVKGMEIEHIEDFRKSKKKWMKLLMGLLLIFLGLLLFIFF